MDSYVDLSHPLDNTTVVYPGDPAFSCCPALTLDKDGVNVHSLALGTHTGTHVDAPSHFFAHGETIDRLPLSRFTGPAFLVDVSNKRPRERVGWSCVAGVAEDIRRAASERGLILFRTGWSQFWGTDAYFDHPYLDGEVAQKLLELGVQFIGIDTLSPDETHVDVGEAVEMDFTVHKILLGAGVIIAENLTNLGHIKDGRWMVCAAPLKISGVDGSPVRAFAWKDTS